MTTPNPLFYLNSIAQAIFDKKGFNILALDVHEISSLTDYVIIAEGNIDKHVAAIAQAIIDQLEQLGQKPVYVEGMKDGDWVVIDYLHIMVHLFMPGLRDKYQLEQLWKEGHIVDLQIDVNPKDTSAAANSSRK
ncbi:MAG: ribosome silencing factor [Verrucomicrobia bacterium]|nr:ribosome silencing factor [Verrucomicrobiota bacterium]